MKILSLKCPNCGANLSDVEFQYGTQFGFCNHCGTRIALYNPNAQYIYNEAEVQQQQVNMQAQYNEMQKMQNEMQKIKYEHKNKTNKRIAGGIILGIGVLLLGCVTIYPPIGLGGLFCIIAGIALLT